MSKNYKVTRGPKGTVVFAIDVIKNERKSLNWTQENLASAADVSVWTVKRAERGVGVGIESAVQIVHAAKLSNDKIPLPLRGMQPVYLVPGGRFEKARDREWHEFKGEEHYATFLEYSANANEVIIVDPKRRHEGRSMLVRIPSRGGEVLWTYENPIDWQPFTVARPGE